MGEPVYQMIIRNAQVINADSQFTADIGVQNGKIITIALHIQESAETEVDATGLMVLPGLIDAHVHLNQPGRSEWEGFETGTRSLAAGGVTSFFDMPLNASPPTIHAEAFDAKRLEAQRDSILDYGLWGGLVPGNVDELSSLHQRGVIGFKAFMSSAGTEDFGRADDGVLLRGMDEIAKLGSLLAVHAESELVVNDLTTKIRAQGRTEAEDYHQSRPIYSEVQAVRRVIDYAKMTGCKLHIVHASSSDVVAVVTQARQAGIDVSVETCPHYLSLTAEDAERLGGVAKCAPPLRNSTEVENLWQSVRAGMVDFISSDHSPSPISMKTDADYFDIWGGISGAQTTLYVLLEEGYWKRNIPLETIVRMTSTNVAKRFGIFPQKGTISVGSDADFVFVDLTQTITLTADALFYRHRHSPYIGQTFRAQIVSTVCRGEFVYQQAESDTMKIHRGEMLQPH